MREDWLEQGYIEFAEYGPENMSINRIGKNIGAARSSFYHHFGDVNLFIDELLQRHWHIAVEYNANGEEHCKRLIPDLYDMLAQYPIPLKFNMQLFRNRYVPRFNYIFSKTYESSGEAFLHRLFAEYLDVHFSHHELKHLWLTIGEAWYSRLDPEDLSAQTMQKHAESILKNISILMDSGLYSTLQKAH